MLKLAAHRLLIGIPSLWLIATIVFFLTRFTPGGPFDQEVPLAPAVRAALNARYLLDQPVWAQYLHFLEGLAVGDLGPSFRYEGEAVRGLITEGLPVSATIGGTALLLAVIVGVSAGTWAALDRGGRIDRLVLAFAAIFTAVPSFVVAPALALVIGIYLRMLPVAGWEGGRLANLVLPVSTLALPHMAAIARLMRASLLDILGQPFIRAARAKGLPPAVVIRDHALPLAIIPVIAYTAPASAGVLTGAMVVETIFDLPGIGRYFVLGAVNRDYTLVMGIVLLYAVLLILANLMADLLQAWLDPRTRPS
jgi:oligopeptide transport system permease protein